MIMSTPTSIANGGSFGNNTERDAKENSISSVALEATATQKSSKKLIYIFSTPCLNSSFIGASKGHCTTCILPYQSCVCSRCSICGGYLITLRSRHHCRRCSATVCGRCSTRNRVNEFQKGIPCRTCDRCAMPCCLVHISQFNVAKDEVPGSSADCVVSSLRPQSRDIYWGLFVLSEVLESPRQCINPACAQPYSFRETCLRCTLPTVSVRPCDVRRVNTRKLSTQSEKLTQCAEELAQKQIATVPRIQGNGSFERFFSKRTTGETEKQVFCGLRDELNEGPKVLLSLAAAGLAYEWTACPHISLSLSDLPNAGLLHIEQVRQSYTIFRAPDNVRYVAFTGDFGMSSLACILDGKPTTREVWACATKEHIGYLCKDQREAESLGATEHVATLQLHKEIIEEVEASNQLNELRKELLSAAKEGSQIVLCGHSIGGAIAALLALRMLLEDTQTMNDKLLCVTFGAPLVAGFGLHDLLQQHDLVSYFQHFVCGSDVVPRLSVLHTFLHWDSVTGKMAEHESVMGTAQFRHSTILWLQKFFASRHIAEQITEDERKTNVGLFSPTHKSTKSSVPSVVEDAQAHMGDLLAEDREPFAHNRSSLRRDSGTNENSGSESADSVDGRGFCSLFTDASRKTQEYDFFGSYNLLQCGAQRYQWSVDPAKTMGLLANRHGMRVLLKDHHIESYNTAILLYLHAFP